MSRAVDWDAKEERLMKIAMRAANRLQIPTDTENWFRALRLRDALAALELIRDARTQGNQGKPLR